ncbi:MAG: UvrD-helicase domain-containing protein, partial [Pseudoxanthomonas sp.]
MSAPRDPYLDLSLHGVQLIEASAGTGKTFTLATLVTRLVVEGGLRLGQILAVTFTEAATQELRKRIRERLQLALQMVDAADATAGAGGADPAAVLTGQLLAAHRVRSGEGADSLRRRLHTAVLEIDLAAMFTIHGFCLRVLREHALEAGGGFDAPELLGNDRALREEVATDLWRIHAQDPAGADDLAALWPAGPPALAADLPLLLRERVLLPPEMPLPADPLPALHAAGQALAEGFRAHGQDFFVAVLAALAAKVLNGSSYRADWIAALQRELADWCQAGDFAAPLDPRLARLTREALLARTNKNQAARTPDSPLCALIPPYLQALQENEEYLARRRAARLHRLRADARERLAALKRQRRVQGYDDLIDAVADALDGPAGDVLARQLRAQYAAALVDEFQDTDARQWRIFERVFGRASDAPALFLIGDPKQAIYGFRGGDVHTYLAAAESAQPAPPLAHNFRSRPALLAAVAALYAQAGAEAFVDPRIGFRQVEAGGRRSDADFLRHRAPAPALTVWRAPPPAQKSWRAADARALAADACVAAIHALLTDARTGAATLADGDARRPLRPGDLAVLVRSHAEATAIQQALAAAGIAAVAAGKQSLFATAQARELHALLLALLHSGDDGRLRTALASVLIGVDAAGIDALDGDAHAHRHWQQRALAWRERLLRGGPLALVGDLLAEHGERLLGLADGERRASNYLQLAELLQEAAPRALGLHGLVDWLGRRIAGADPDDETQLLRLESDAQRVQIVTLHKSKGLQYPLVFLPFAGLGGRAPSAGRRTVAFAGEQGRRLHWKLPLAEAEWEFAEEAARHEQRGEDARLLYVGLTRAEQALWIASGDFPGYARTPLAAMLADLDALAAQPGVRIEHDPPPTALPRLPPDADAAVPPARIAR